MTEPFCCCEPHLTLPSGATIHQASWDLFWSLAAAGHRIVEREDGTIEVAFGSEPASPDLIEYAESLSAELITLKDEPFDLDAEALMRTARGLGLA